MRDDEFAARTAAKANSYQQQEQQPADDPLTRSDCWRVEKVRLREKPIVLWLRRAFEMDELMIDFRMFLEVEEALAPKRHTGWASKGGLMA
jgi:hypothetical protein